jgi:hypothetical protein
MKNIFDDEIVQETKDTDTLKVFLGVCSHMELSKNSLSICSYIAKNDNKLIASNIKNFLIMDYTGNEENGVYEYLLSKAFDKLDGFNTNETNLEKYPQAEIDLVNGEWVNINASQAQLITDAYKFVTDDVTRYFMAGIYFEKGFVVSTDGRRLFYSQGFDNFPSVILPNSKCLEWLLKKGTNIKYKIDKTFSIFQFEYKGSMMFYCASNIEGQFPNWQKVVPEKQRFTIGVPDLTAWKDIYSKIVLLKSKSNSERIYIKHEKDDEVSVEWDSKIIGKMKWIGFYDETRLANEKLGWEKIEDTTENPRKPFISLLTTLAINYKYFNDALTLYPLKEIQFTEWIKAVTFIYTNNSISIVMPMQKD